MEMCVFNMYVVNDKNTLLIDLITEAQQKLTVTLLLSM